MQNKKKGHGHVLKLYRTNARVGHRAWNLLDSHFYRLLVQDCFYCGAAPLKRHIHNHGSNKRTVSEPYNGIDRVDNTKGYILNNVVTCCKNCNMMKAALTQTQFLTNVKRIYEFLMNKPRKNARNRKKNR